MIEIFAAALTLAITLAAVTTSMVGILILDRRNRTRKGM